MRREIQLLLVASMITACAQTAVKKETPVAPQSLFGRWQQENTTTLLDLTGGSLKNEFYFKFQPAKGGTCECLMDVRGGTLEGGTARMSDCGYKDGTASPNSDPGCQTLEGSYSYASNGTTLSFTNVLTKVTTPFRANGGPEPAAELAK